MIDHSRKDDMGRDVNQMLAWQKREKAVFHQEILKVFSEDGTEAGLRAGVAEEAEGLGEIGRGQTYVEMALILHQGGEGAIYYDDEREVLEKVYGKAVLANWSNLKVDRMYAKKFAHAFAKVAKAVVGKQK